MLGLPDLFHDTEEKENYKNAKENILGNGKPEFITRNGRQVKNLESILTIDRQIQKTLTSTENYIILKVYAKKSTLVAQLRSSNTYFTTKKNNEQIDKTNIENQYRGQPNSVIVAGTGSNTQTKGQYLEIVNKEISNYTLFIEENTTALNKLNSLSDNDKIKKHKYNMNFKASHYTTILRESKKYYYDVINQIHSNYLMFKQGRTKNMMDYNKTRVVYFHNQIKIMREDLQYY